VRATRRASIDFSPPIASRTGVIRQNGIRIPVMSPPVHPTADDALTMRLHGGPAAAATARRALSRLRADIDPPLMETLRLLVTELVANSVRHTEADTVMLKVLIGRSAVWTEVTDEGPGFDPAATGTPRADHTGWGLFLVERLAERWGVARDEEGTKVWFELRRG
jgi:anti-sigma regulatory factor (Ser/Thr protein kinase)